MKDLFFISQLVLLQQFIVLCHICTAYMCGPRCIKMVWFKPYLKIDWWLPFVFVVYHTLYRQWGVRLFRVWDCNLVFHCRNMQDLSHLSDGMQN